MQIRHRIALGLEIGGGERRAGGGLHPHAASVINIVVVKALLFEFLGGKPLGELADDGADHLQMRKFLRGHVVEQPRHAAVGHGVALGEVAHGGGQFAVRPAELAGDGLGQAGVFVLDVDGKLQAFFIDPHVPASYSKGKGRSTQS